MKFFFLKFKVKFKTRENKLVVYTSKNVFKVSIPYRYGNAYELFDTNPVI